MVLAVADGNVINLLRGRLVCRDVPVEPIFATFRIDLVAGEAQVYLA